jgi:hypothetical protein
MACFFSLFHFLGIEVLFSICGKQDEFDKLKIIKYERGE